jgi:uncharacterized protein (TIGR02453 family)
MAFTGFTPDSLAFLSDLAEHNDRAWFAENRDRYERELLGRQRDFVDAVGAAFVALDQRVQAVPAVDRSIFRINRDTRFAHDKSPFKTYADMWFWIGDDRKSAPGYFLRMEPGRIMIGGGAHQLTAEQIARFRLAVVDGLHGKWLEHLLDDLRAAGFSISEPSRKTVPRGFSAQQDRAELLKHTELHAMRRFSPPPAEFIGPEFVDWSMQQFAQVKPLIDWLVEQLGGVYPTDMRRP